MPTLTLPMILLVAASALGLYWLDWYRLRKEGAANRWSPITMAMIGAILALTFAADTRRNHSRDGFGPNAADVLLDLRAADGK